MKVIFDEKDIQLIVDMLVKQEQEHLEQFATIMGKYTNDGLVTEHFEIWDNSLLEQTRTTVTPASQKMWNAIGENMKMKNADFLITLHTHPEEYGTNPTGRLDSSDTKAFKDWTQNFDDFSNRICINGIVTGKDGLLLTYYNKEKDNFITIPYEVVQNKHTLHEEQNHIR